MNQGKFITLEGVEGVGKTSIIKLLSTELERAGIEFVLTREPGGTSIGETIREILLSHQKETLMPLTEALLFFASREQHITQLIQPALAAGKWVICDRFIDSSLAYQGAGRGVAAYQLDALTSWVQRDCIPNLTILLDAPVEVGLARIKGRDKDRIESEDVDFFNRVRQRYLELAQRNLARYHIIDSSQPMATVHEAVLCLIKDQIASR